MQPQCNVFIGIDVSKAELVIAFQRQGKWVKDKVANEEGAIMSWLSGIALWGKRFVLEPTGVYSERLIYCLHQQGADFALVNPQQSRAMSKVLLKTNKTDDQDAQTLSIFGEKLELMPYKMPTEQQKQQKEAFSALASLQKQERQLQNQLHAFEYRVKPNPLAVKALKDVLASVQTSIEALQQEIKTLQDEDEARRCVKLLTSIPSVGQCTAEAVVALLGDLRLFENAKAFAKFVGLSPCQYSSGTTVHRRSVITKKGNSKIRSLLFNCARNAIRFNKPCKELYHRLINKGKNGKIALTAVMHKIARLIFGVLRSGKEFDPNYFKEQTFCA